MTHVLDRSVASEHLVNRKIFLLHWQWPALYERDAFELENHFASWERWCNMQLTYYYKAHISACFLCLKIFCTLLMHFVPRSNDVDYISVEVLNSPDGQVETYRFLFLKLQGGEVQPLVKFEFKVHRMKFTQMYLMIWINQLKQFQILL